MVARCSTRLLIVFLVLNLLFIGKLSPANLNVRKPDIGSIMGSETSQNLTSQDFSSSSIQTVYRFLPEDTSIAPDHELLKRDNYFEPPLKTFLPVSSLQASFESTHRLNARKTLIEHNGRLFLAYVTNNPYPIAWLTCSDNNGTDWYTPAKVWEGASSISAIVEIYIYGELLFYSIVNTYGISPADKELLVKIIQYDMWWEITNASVINIDSNGYIHNTKFITFNQTLFLFWGRSSYMDCMYRIYHDGEWSRAYYVATSTFISNFFPIVLNISEVETLYFFYQYYPANTIYVSKTLDGFHWDTATPLFSHPDSFHHIVVAKHNGKIHLAASSLRGGEIFYASSDNLTTWSPLKVIATYVQGGDVGEDRDPRETVISFNEKEDILFIAYENHSREIDVITSSDNGKTFRRFIDFKNFPSQCPGFSDSGNYFLFVRNSSELHIMKTIYLATEFTFRTTQLSPIALSSWNDYGFSYSGFDHGGGIFLRIIAKDGMTQLFPKEGFINVTSLPSGHLDGIYFDHVGIFNGTWAAGLGCQDGIIAEILMRRNPLDRPRLYSFAINFTVSYPVKERFKITSHIKSLENCVITPSGITLPANQNSGFAIVGPIYRDINNTWPDVLGFYGEHLSEERYLKVEILDPYLKPITSYTQNESDVVNSSLDLSFTTWGGRHIKYVPESFPLIYIKMVFIAIDASVPFTINYLSLEFSMPPKIIMSDVSSTSLYRGDLINITLSIEDREDKECYINITPYIVGPSQKLELLKFISFYRDPNPSILHLIFLPTYNAPIGTYKVGVLLRDSTGNVSNESLPFDINVLNNPPTPPTFSIFPATLLTGDPINVVITTPGSDLETPENNLTYNYLFFRGEELYLSILNSTSLSASLSEGIIKKEETWRIEVSTWDGLDESKRVSAELIVKNSAPEPNETLPTSIIINEDSQGGPYNYIKWFRDKDGDNLTFEFKATSNINISIINSEMYIVPSMDFHGTGEIEIAVSDGTSNISIIIPVIVLPVNDPPTWISPGNISVLQDEWVFVKIDAGDLKDGEPVSVEWLIDVIPNIHKGINFVSYPNGSFKLKPDNSMIGTYNVPFLIQDSNYTFHDSLTINIINKNDKPLKPTIIVEPPQLYIIGMKEITLKGNATDPDIPWGDELTFIWESNISGIIVYGEVIKVTLPPGDHLITLTVRDKENLTNSTQLTISIREKLPSEKPILKTSILYLLAFIIPFLIGLIMLILFLRSKKEMPEEESKKQQLVGSSQKEETPSPSESVAQPQPSSDSAPKHVEKTQNEETISPMTEIKKESSEEEKSVETTETNILKDESKIEKKEEDPTAIGAIQTKGTIEKSVEPKEEDEENSPDSLPNSL